MTAAAVVLFCAMPVPLAAQWLHYPSVGVPMNARAASRTWPRPAPKTPDGKPDLSGIWNMEEEPILSSLKAARTCWRRRNFRTLAGASRAASPIYRGPAEAVRARTEQYGKDDPQTHCLPTGVVKMHTDLLMRKIVQIPELFSSSNERNTTYRQIFTDGRPLPVDPQPTWNGYSSGKWVGDTLVVESNGFRDGLWLDHNGSPMTDAAKLTERIRRVNYGRLEIEPHG